MSEILVSVFVVIAVCLQKCVTIIDMIHFGHFELACNKLNVLIAVFMNTATLTVAQEFPVMEDNFEHALNGCKAVQGSKEVNIEQPRRGERDNRTRWQWLVSLALYSSALGLVSLYVH